MGIATALVAEEQICEQICDGTDISIMYCIKKIIEIDKLKEYV